MAKRLGLEYKPQPIAWDAKDMELDAGNIDCIWNGFTMTGREDDYTWTRTPYMANTQVFVVGKDSGISQARPGRQGGGVPGRFLRRGSVKGTPDLTRNL